MISEKTISDLSSQINQTIDSLEKKSQASSEDYIILILKKYKLVKTELDLKKDKIDLGVLKKLLNGARGYMETSSDYNQDFLNEMGRTEKLIKSF